MCLKNIKKNITYTSTHMLHSLNSKDKPFIKITIQVGYLHNSGSTTIFDSHIAEGIIKSVKIVSPNSKCSYFLLHTRIKYQNEVIGY